MCYSCIVLAGGGAVAAAYPLVVVESDTARVSFPLPLSFSTETLRHGLWCPVDHLTWIRPGPSSAPSDPLPGTFFGPSLDITSEKLYDLAPDIPDVMGLRALRLSGAVVKVMSVTDSRCIRVVTPDDHVKIGFHEILLHDMGEEELPFMATSELNYLRRVWPRALYAFMSRYQQDLERMQKCKERFGSTQSGNCTHCGKYIAFYHL